MYIQLNVKSLLTFFFLKIIFYIFKFQRYLFYEDNAYINKTSVYQTYINVIAFYAELSTLYLIPPFAHINKELNVKSWYEGCSNMNASSFITFVTYMLRQNGIRFYKGLYITFKLPPDLKQNPVDLSSYRPSSEGHFCILTNSMLRINRWNSWYF